MENQAGRPVGEILLMARGAGIWKEAAGSGNIIKGKQVSETQYANGEHMYVSTSSNLTEGLPSGKDGVLVDAAGNWRGSDSYNAMSRAENFVSGGKDLSPSNSDPARYYFASCIWDPREENSKIEAGFAGLIAMGPTGLVEEGKPIPPLEVEVGYNKYIADSLKESRDIVSSVGSLSSTQGKATEFFDNMALEPGAEAEKKKIPSPSSVNLGNEDCQNPFIFNLDDVSAGGLSGWNSQNQWASRWDFTPLPPPSLSDSLKSALLGAGVNAVKNLPVMGTIFRSANAIREASGAAWDAAKGVWNTVTDILPGGEEGGEGEEASQEETLKPIDPKDNPPLDPKVSLSESVSSEGYNTAMTFWETRNGQGPAGILGMMASVVIILVSLCIFTLYILPVAIISVLNFALSVYLFNAGFILIAGLIGMAFRGTTKR